ncbi:MAG: agmatine deiminase family protein [Planctomycetes bacterium]|nr:agmatine deiminase family protein [Planctomycetota bacterium]
MRRTIGALCLVGLLLSTAPAVAASTFVKGETVSLSVGTLSTSYRAYWVSSKDGYLGYGNPFKIATLSLGLHTITVYIYRTSDWVLVYKGSGSVEIVAPAPAPTPTPTPTPTPAPTTGLTYAPGEFEEVKLLLLGCPDTYMVSDIYPQFLAGIRGVCPTRIYVDNDYVRYDLVDLFNQAGVGNTDHSYVTAPVDTIWIRDYGPLFMKNQGRLEVVDLQYYPGRDNDDAIPGVVARADGYPVRPLSLYWEGGNYTSDGQGNTWSTNWLYGANTNYTQSQVNSKVSQAFTGKHNTLEYQLNDGGTRHLDMFASWVGPTRVILSRFPAGHQNYDRMERNATKLRGMGYTLTRIDQADSGYSSHANSILVNKVAFVPTYGNATTDAAALTAYQGAGYRAIGVDCRRIIQWSGAVHCITITVPR